MALDESDREEIAAIVAAAIVAAMPAQPEPPPVAEQVAVIEAVADAEVAVIEARADADVAVIEAVAEAQESDDGDGAGDPLDTVAGDADEPALVQPVTPTPDHWLFRPLSHR